MSAELQTQKSPACQIKNKLYRSGFKDHHFGWVRKSSFPGIPRNNCFTPNKNFRIKKINFKKIQPNISNEPIDYSNYNNTKKLSAIGACFATFLLGGHLFVSFLLSIVLIFLLLIV